MITPLALAFANAERHGSLPAGLAGQSIATLRIANAEAVSTVTCTANICGTLDQLADGLAVIKDVANDNDVMRILGTSE
jgi:hypothetical protein